MSPSILRLGLWNDWNTKSSDRIEVFNHVSVNARISNSKSSASSMSSLLRMFVRYSEQIKDYG